MIAVLMTMLAACSSQYTSYVPPGYPSSYSRTIQRAFGEGTLTIWSTVDRGNVTELLAGFRRRYPKIKVRYVEMQANSLYDRFHRASNHGAEVPDLLWSSAMDLQIKLVNDGYSQAYLSPERRHLPEWANWKDQAWGTTAEPIGIVYNRKEVPAADVPRTHSALTRLLESQPAWADRKIGTYDIARSGAGYLFLSQDEQATHDVWRMVRAMGINHPQGYFHAEDMLDDVAKGRLAIAYNVIGSYAVDRMAGHPELGLVLPRDFTLQMSRIAVIPARARHPNAAGLFLDFLLSRQGQQFLADEDMPSVRSDVKPPPGLHEDGVPIRAIRVSPALLVDRDQLTRRYIFKRWNQAIGTLHDHGGETAE